MDLDHARNPNERFFPFESLPDEIRSRILSLLPITVLVVCKAVSPSWRSIIRSPSFTDSYHPSRDPIFLLHSKRFRTSGVCGYIPSTDRWIHFRLRLSLRLRQQVSILPTTGTSLLLLFKESGGRRLSVVDPFSPPRPIHFLPRIPYLHREYRILALIQDNPSDYIIVAVSHRDDIHTQIYDSRSGRWKELTPSQVDWWQMNAVYLDGLLYCLSSHPNRLLKFDPVGGQWSTLDVHLPIPFFGRHLLGFGGELYVTGDRWEDTVVTRIGIWKLHWSEMAWKEFDFMPDKYLAVFGSRQLSCFTITACVGMICFSTRDPKEIVMCDLAVRRWWCPQPCNMLGKRGFTIGSAIEPHINLLLK